MAMRAYATVAGAAELGLLLVITMQISSQLTAPGFWLAFDDLLCLRDGGRTLNCNTFIVDRIAVKLS
jgi:hypothetical protein